MRITPMCQAVMLQEALQCQWLAQLLLCGFDASSGPFCSLSATKNRKSRSTGGQANLRYGCIRYPFVTTVWRHEAQRSVYTQNNYRNVYVCFKRCYHHCAYFHASFILAIHPPGPAQNEMFLTTNTVTLEDVLIMYVLCMLDKRKKCKQRPRNISQRPANKRNENVTFSNEYEQNAPSVLVCLTSSLNGPQCGFWVSILTIPLYSNKSLTCWLAKHRYFEMIEGFKLPLGTSVCLPSNTCLLSGDLGDRTPVILIRNKPTKKQIPYIDKRFYFRRENDEVSGFSVAGEMEGWRTPVFDVDKLCLIKVRSMKAGVDHLFHVPATSEMAQNTKGRNGIKGSQAGQVSESKWAGRKTQMRRKQKVGNEIWETNIGLMKRRNLGRSRATERLEGERKHDRVDERVKWRLSHFSWHDISSSCHGEREREGRRSQGNWEK